MQSYYLADAAAYVGIEPKELEKKAKFGHVQARNYGSKSFPKFVFSKEALDKLKADYQEGKYGDRS